MFADTGDALPQFLTVKIEDFHKYKGDWLLWRNLGHYNESGAWVAPVSFNEAMELPKVMLDVFFELDNLIQKMMKQMTKKRNGK